MEALEAIMTRKSVRHFLAEPVPDETLRTILQAAMSGPSCTNARDWQFLVVRDKAMLQKMAEANGRPAQPLRGAAVGILVCGDLTRAFPPAPDYWVVDGAIAAQNLILAAHALGVGSVWLGTWPQLERVQAQVRLFGLPAAAVPHSLIALGWPDPAKEAPGPRRDRPAWEESRVHWEQW